MFSDYNPFLILAVAAGILLVVLAASHTSGGSLSWKRKLYIKSLYTF